MSRIKQIISLSLLLVMLISTAIPPQLFAMGFAIMGTPLPRLAGTNRYGTAVAISQEGWATGADVIVLARGDEYADALAGVPLAYANDAPILLTAPTRLPVSTKEEIQRLGATTAYILGGTGAVSSAVENEVAQLGLTINRIPGKNRFDTAAKIAAVIAPSGANTVFLAYGQEFADALSASSYAAVLNAPILLTRTETLPEVTADALSALNPTNTYVIGGEGVISSSLFAGLTNATRVGGSNRYHTSVVLAELFASDADSMFIATGLAESGGADAITGGALAAKRGTGILLVSKTLPSAVATYLSENIQHATILGGAGAVPEELAQAVKEALYTPELVSVTSISIKTPPAQTHYTEGDTLVLDGLVVTLAKSDGSEEDVPLAAFAAKGIATEPANGSALTAADTVVTITHIESGKSVDQAIAVDSEVWVYHIYVNTLPHKTTYEAGEKLNLTGLVVRLLKTGGPSEDVPLADFDAKGIVTDPANGSILTAADTKVQVTHTPSGRSVDVGISVLPGVAELSIISPASKVNYMAGEKLNLQGLVVQLTREGGGTEQVPLNNFAAKGITTDPTVNTTLTSTNTQVTITHEISGKSTSYGITVASQGIKIGNTTYKLGEDPLPEGLTWNAEEARVEMDGYIGTSRITYASDVAQDLNIYVKSDSSITVDNQSALMFHNLILGGVPGAKLAVCSNYTRAIQSSSALTVSDINLVVEHTTTSPDFSCAIYGHTTVNGQGMLTIHSQRLTTSYRSSNQGINGVLTLQNSASASINVEGNEYTTDVWGINPFSSSAYKSLYLNGTGTCEISVVNAGTGIAHALYTQGQTFGYYSIGAWDLDYVKYTLTDPGTADISYIPSGEITDIYPTNVTFVSDSFTYPVGTTYFTFKQDGQPMRAVYRDGNWTFAPLPLFPITHSIEGGTAYVTVNPENLGEAGCWVQITVYNIEAGKELQGVEVEDQDGNPVAVTAISSQNYIFIMPTKAVDITVILQDLPPLVEIGNTVVDLRAIPSQFSGISWNDTDKQIVLNGYNGPYIHSRYNSSVINASILVEADSTITGTATKEALLFSNGGLNILSNSGATLTLTSGSLRVVLCRAMVLNGADLIVEHENSDDRIQNFLRSIDCGLNLLAGSNLTLNTSYNGSTDGNIYGINGILNVGQGATAEITVRRAGGAGNTSGIRDEPVLWGGGSCDITVINLGSGGARPVWNNPAIANSHYTRGTWDSYLGTIATPVAYTVKVPVTMDVLNLGDINITEASGSITSFSLYTDAAYSNEVTNSMALTADPAGTNAYIKTGTNSYYKVTIIREDKPNTLGLLTRPIATDTLF